MSELIQQRTPELNRSRSLQWMMYVEQCTQAQIGLEAAVLPP